MGVCVNILMNSSTVTQAVGISFEQGYAERYGWRGSSRIWPVLSIPAFCMIMMFSFMLTDGESPLKACKHCNRIFVASRPNAEFCSP